MSWRSNQADRRSSYLAERDEAEADSYHALVGRLSRADEDAYLSDLGRLFVFRSGMAVLDAGAGTGAMSKLLSRIEGLLLTALEPAPEMLAKLKSHPELARVQTAQGFCDHVEDRRHFDENQFDVIVSRQLCNELFDPLRAFENWHYWLSPGGSVVLVDGLYEPSAWEGGRETEVDELPLSVCQTIALIPYLLEAAGFRVEAVQRMEATNALPSTQTTRYVVVARKP